jgi:hypothetical protein
MQVNTIAVKIGDFKVKFAGKTFTSWMIGCFLTVQFIFPSVARANSSHDTQPSVPVTWQNGRLIDHPTPVKDIFRDRTFATMVAENLSKLIGVPVSIEDLVTQETLDRVVSLIIPLSGEAKVETLEGIGHLRNLEEFLLGSQLFRSLPEEMRGLTKLSLLHLSSNRVEFIPDWIGELTNLTYFNLQASQTRGQIPESIGNLTKLESLMLDNNELSGNLPDSMVHLRALHTIRLQSNMLEDLRVLNHMPSLSSVNILPQRLGQKHLGTVSAGSEFHLELPGLFSQAYEEGDIIHDPKGVVVSGNPDAWVSEGGHLVYLPTNIIGRPEVTLRLGSNLTTAITYTYDVR